MSKFDDKIKEKLYDYESEFPDHIWSSVKKEIQPERKSYFLFWFFSFIFLIAGASTFWFLANPFKEKQLLQSSFKSSDQHITDSKSMPIAETSNEKSSIVQPIVTSSEETSISKIDLNQESKVILKQSISSYGMEATSVLKKENPFRTASIVEDVNKENPISSDINSLNPALVQPLTIAESLNVEISNSENSKNENILLKNSEAENLVVADSRKLTHTSLLVPHQRLVLGMDQSDKFEEIYKSMKKHASLACPTFIRKQNLTFAEVYFSNVFAHKSLVQNRGEDQTYLNLRKQTENNHLSYAVGARLGIGWESGIAFKSGIDITQINEKFQYTDPKSIQKKIITVVKYIYDDKYNIVDSTKTTEEIEIPGTNKIVNKNSYTFIDLPILFQYTIPGTRRLSYSISVGPYINIAMSRSGKILDSRVNNHNVRPLVNLKDADYFKNNIGLSFHGALGINYQLTNVIQIVIEPSIRIMPTSVTKLTYALNQNYLFTNISAGLKYKI